MGSFCITAWSPAAGSQELDIGSGNPIGTIREGKLKSRGVCSPIRQGSSRRRRGRRAEVKGAQTSQCDLVHLCDRHIHVACLQIHPSIFFLCENNHQSCSDHSTYVVKTVGFCKIPFVEEDFSAKDAKQGVLSAIPTASCCFFWPRNTHIRNVTVTQESASFNTIFIRLSTPLKNRNNFIFNF